MVEPRNSGEPVLTVIITCMGRLHHLRQSLPLVLAQEDVRVVVVDYGCPDLSGAWVETNFNQVQVVHAGPRTRFNISEARNLGAAGVKTPWVCFMDADTLPGAGSLQAILAKLQERTFYLADPCPHELAGMVVCQLEDFKAIGGYDALFSGWGGEDGDLYARLRRNACRQAAFSSESIHWISHGDEERTRFHDIPDRFLSLRINGLYLQVKTDLARITDTVELPLHHRQAIRSRISQMVLSNPHAAVRMDIELPWTTDFTQPPEWALKRSISYVFEARPGDAP